MAGPVRPARASLGSLELLGPAGRRAAPAAPGATFTNPLYPGADPWVAFHDGWYYACQSGPGHCVEVWKSRSLTRRGTRAVAWHAPRHGWNRAQLWAPELHHVAGRWHVYYAASDGHNATHRMGVLRALSDDPQGPYEDCGRLYTGDDVSTGRHNRWAIDGTVFELRGRLYFLWSGWEDHRDVQHLYVAAMSDPGTVATNRVRLCANDCHRWERVGERVGDGHDARGLHEGPQVLRRHGRLMIVYSCSGSWQPTYKLGLLHMDERSDPLDPANWTKHPEPVFESTRDVFGVGHCCFTQSPDGGEDWMLYHSKRYRWDSWTREVRAQRYSWRPDGLPHFGAPAASDELLSLPSGEVPSFAAEAA